MANLKALIEGLPGSGKTYFSNKHLTKRGYLIKDVDDYSQPLFEEEYHDCPDFKKRLVGKVRKQVNSFLKNNSTKSVVMAGISTFLFENGCEDTAINCNDGCHKIWLDIGPDDFNYDPNMPQIEAILDNKDFQKLSLPTDEEKATVVELLESTRRAILREFSEKEVKVWKDMDDVVRKENGSFWELPRPGEVNAAFGNIIIPSSGLSPGSVEYNKLFTMNLNDFIDNLDSTHPYFDNMLDIMIEDSNHLNRAKAIQRGFIPMKPPIESDPKSMENNEIFAILPDISNLTPSPDKTSPKASIRRSTRSRTVRQGGANVRRSARIANRNNGKKSARKSPPKSARKSAKKGAKKSPPKSPSPIKNGWVPSNVPIKLHKDAKKLDRYMTLWYDPKQNVYYCKNMRDHHGQMAGTSIPAPAIEEMVIQKWQLKDTKSMIKHLL